ncbi:bacteriocin immunity protein [Pseudomonas fulva]|uniref:Bacteriocin immunity protein n=1 Tax=Pseudomonas fulva TaxID=47880 RepID=A0A7S9Q7E0_9PSED|nr:MULTISPECIES: bacteriocin immunity protein [Pseudomonas]QPH43152.1 bacteriocin immunity protein [Pseudomonas fulva]QPH48215.1 bacteriocin immunity protein [Pseudomonas fulva]UNT12655.1 bacteriocin immunity protein [Pseudomonas sp. I3-I5]HCP30523.1 bacteriocin immunity protein [Pseudomonas sp.]
MTDFTEREFFQWVYALYHSDPQYFPNDREHTRGILEFERLVQHPATSNLIYRPHRVGIQSSPQAVVDEVKRWRAEQGLPGFKPS